jgi:hypothetical protein
MGKFHSELNFRLTAVGSHTSFDGFIRRYDLNNITGSSTTIRPTIKKKDVWWLKEPFAVSFSPEGQKLAVGFNDSPAVNIFSSSDFSLLYETSGEKDRKGGSLFNVA